MDSVLALQALAIVCGLISAFLWWEAARSSSSNTASLDSSVGGDGDMAMQLGDGKFLVYRFARAARLNAWAAGLTGAAVLFQSVALAFQIAI